MTAPIKLPPDPTELIATVRTLEEAVDAFRLMKTRLGVTNEFMEDVYGFAKGHPDKVLGRSETKKVGYDTFRLFCEVFAVEFRMYVDMEQVKRMEDIWEERKRPLFPWRKPGQVSKKLIEMAKPHVAKQMGQAGAAKKMIMLSAEHRSKIARKAAKTRWRNRSKAAKLERAIKKPAKLAGLSKSPDSAVCD